MDGTIKQSRRFAELERLSDDYFRYHLASVMDETRDYLARKQGEEMKEYSTSLGGVLSMMASSAQPLNDPYQLLKVTGEWNSKTTEDYVEMCKEKIAASEDIQHDLAYMAGQWRDAVVKEIGRERYDELSEQLGGDLAYAYMDYRLEQQMIDKLVKDRMPKSSADYIIRKAAESSLFGLPQMLSRSPLAEEIEKRGEAAYRPSKVEQGAGWLLGVSADTVMLGGAGSWAAFARFIGVDAAVSATMAHLEPEDPKSISVEQCISQGVFGSEHNVFEDFRREAATMTADKDSFTATANEQLKKQIPVCNFNFTDWMKKQQPFPFLKGLQDKLKQERPERYKDVPLVVAPGQEEAYLKSLEEKKQTDAEEPEQVHQETVQPEKEPEVMQETGVHPVNDLSETSASNGNTGGWEDLLGTLGLSGMGDIAGNLGYVMAMLPDILLGVFTGKTQSLNIKDNLLPIASIVAGMFVRNPLLKMLLIGLGGANLLNKAGHEVLRERSEGEMNTANRSAAQYRHYPDEPLNPRITNPVLQGNMLVATIDRVPCTIQLSQTVTDAYRAGALPLNTLANAVLARSEQLRQRASDNYDNGQQETIVRTRGIQ
ncbi:hypothetical protein [Alistipes senegalensis]|jgi:hypothetical protein|uniref:hypothetical protein n=1 Tax=Alistipes senegalensis TaxID=1288121 RepID=UPI00266E9F02|nr:hypothetical protein [Alistipes senegalensis]